MKLSKSKIFGTIVVILACQWLPAVVNAEDLNPVVAEGHTMSESATKKAEIKQIEQQTTEAKEVLKQKVDEIDQTKIEAERVGRERLELEKEVAIKEKEALLSKQEAEALMKVANIQNDREAIKQAKVIEKKAQDLEHEAVLSKEKLTLVESKANLVQEKLDANEAIIKRIQSELAVLKKAQDSKLGVGHKLTKVSVIAIIGLMSMLLLNFIMRTYKSVALRQNQQLVNSGVIRESESVLRTRTLASLFGWLGYIVIFLMTAYYIMNSFGFDVAPLIAGAGIAGLAFGFGGQYLIRDIINGVFILLEGQIRVNDVVKIGEHGGLVEGVNLRIVTLRDLEGRVIVIPNGEIKTVINYTKEFAFALLDIGIAYKENVDRVIEVIKETGRELRKDSYFNRLIKEELEMLGVDEFADSQVTIKFRIKTLPIKQWEVAREFRRRLKNRFDELGIEIPFPHRTLYWGGGTENKWLKDLLESQQTKPYDKC
ncbi:MAG: small-conductance mechanosensitive channel [Candidatus Omnitrophota bacterium]|jgi:small-conductance mechanosensitive channel